MFLVLVPPVLLFLSTCGLGFVSIVLADNLHRIPPALQDLGLPVVAAWMLNIVLVASCAIDLLTLLLASHRSFVRSHLWTGQPGGQSTHDVMRLTAHFGVDVARCVVFFLLIIGASFVLFVLCPEVHSVTLRDWLAFPFAWLMWGTGCILMLLVQVTLSINVWRDENAPSDSFFRKIIPILYFRDLRSRIRQQRDLRNAVNQHSEADGEPQDQVPPT